MVRERVWEALATVHDPEIPPCSITDLGIVEDVRVSDDALEIDLLPTFVGCPALDVIREDVTTAVEEIAEGRAVHVRFLYSPPWTSDRITERGHEALKTYGITPPGSGQGDTRTTFIPLSAVHGERQAAACPFCGATETVLESDFGPTLCRSIRFCPSCRNPFEAFKPKTLQVTPA